MPRVSRPPRLGRARSRHREPGDALLHLSHAGRPEDLGREQPVRRLHRPVQRHHHDGRQRHQDLPPPDRHRRAGRGNPHGRVRVLPQHPPRRRDRHGDDQQARGSRRRHEQVDRDVGRRLRLDDPGEHRPVVRQVPREPGRDPAHLGRPAGPLRRPARERHRARCRRQRARQVLGGRLDHVGQARAGPGGPRLHRLPRLSRLVERLHAAGDDREPGRDQLQHDLRLQRARRRLGAAPDDVPHVPP